MNRRVKSIICIGICLCLIWGNFGAIVKADKLESKSFNYNDITVHLNFPSELSDCDLTNYDNADHLSISITYENCMIADVYLASKNYFYSQMDFWNEAYDTRIIKEDEKNIVFITLVNEMQRLEPEKYDFPFSDEVLQEYKYKLQYSESLIEGITVDFEGESSNPKENVSILETPQKDSYTMDEIIQIIEQHYNEIENRDAYYVSDCQETEYGFFAIVYYHRDDVNLEETPTASVNVLFSGLQINTTTGQVVDDWGNSWSLFDDVLAEDKDTDNNLNDVSITENNSLEFWRDVYYEFISNTNGKNDRYHLLYLNDDDIPELYIIKGGSKGKAIYTYSEKGMTSIGLGTGDIKYHDKENILDHFSYGYKGADFDQYYSIENGEFKLVATALNPYDYENSEFYGKYAWDYTEVSEDTYNSKRNKLFSPNGAIEILEFSDDGWCASSGGWMTYDEILEYLSVENPEDDYENYARAEWIDQHMEYANSDQYKMQVVQGFSGALNDALGDIKDNGMITTYNTLDSVNTILDFNLDLTDEQEYELLLAQILFSKTGTDSIDVIYDEYLKKNVLTICDLLIDKILPEMNNFATKENLEHLKELRDTLKGLVYGDAQYDETLSQIIDGLNELVDFNDSNILDACAGACDSAGLTFASDFLLNEIETASDTLYHAIVCMAAAEAYCNTSDAFGKMLLKLRRNIAIPSDDARFAPDMVSEMGVTDETIWKLLELKNADNSIGPDPINTPVYLSVLASAIEKYYIQLEAAKVGNASEIALNALAAFSEETLDNLVSAELNVCVSLFECLPVVKQFSAIKDMFDGTQFVIDTFTKIDSRAYLGTMVMRLYAIAYIHYFTVDELSNTDVWGMTGILLNESEFSKDEQYVDAVLFDESIAVYRAILSVATEYAEEYYTTYYETANSILNQYPHHQYSFPSYVDTDSDIFKSVKQKIIELQIQKNDLAYEWCHSSKMIFNQLQGVNTYDSSEMLIYSFKCPVSVTFKNEFGDVIATLCNGKSIVDAGYEQYFFTSEVISGSGEYVKIASVPKSYEVVIEGTGTGRMDVSVSEYNDGRLGETKQFFGVPVTEDSSGYFEKEEKGSKDFRLVMDNTVYVEGDYSNIELKDGNKTTLYIAIVVIGATSIGLAGMVLKRKRFRK